MKKDIQTKAQLLKAIRYRSRDAYRYLFDTLELTRADKELIEMKGVFVKRSDIIHLRNCFEKTKSIGDFEQMKQNIKMEDFPVNLLISAEYWEKFYQLVEKLHCNPPED